MNFDGLIGWDVEDTVAPLATATVTIEGESTIVRVVELDTTTQTTTRTLSFSFNTDYVRGTYPWTEDAGGFLQNSDLEFYVMRWSPLPLTGAEMFAGVPTFTIPLNASQYASLTGFFTHLFVLIAGGVATEYVDVTYSDATPPEHYEFVWNIGGSAQLVRDDDSEDGYFALEMDGSSDQPTDSLPGFFAPLTHDLASGGVDPLTLDGIFALDGNHNWANNTPPDGSYTTYLNSYTATIALT